MSNTITTIDRAALQNLRHLVEERLQGLGEELGVQFSLGGGTYSNAGHGHFSKLTIAVVGENGEVESKEASDFRRLAHLYGMDADDLGMEFQSNGDTFTLCGVNTRGRKYPFLARRKADGKSYKFTQDGIVRAKKLLALTNLGK